MRTLKRTLGCAAAVILCLTASSRADFIISHTRADGTGSLSGYHIFRFYALNTRSGLNPTSTMLAGLDFTFQSLGQPFKYDIADLAPTDERNDVNIYGIGLSDVTPTGTFVKIGSDLQSQGALHVPILTPNISSPTYDAVAFYAPRTDFRVVTVNLSGLRPDATTGSGALFAVVVVPLDSSVRLSGQIADEIGVSAASGAEPVSSQALGDSLGVGAAPQGSEPVGAGTPGYFQVPEYIASAPEPAGLLPLGLVAFALVRRVPRRC